MALFGMWARRDAARRTAVLPAYSGFMLNMAAGQDIQQRRLAASRAAADEDILAVEYSLFQEVSASLWQRPNIDGRGSGRKPIAPTRTRENSTKQEM
ncbi:MAG: hypothetical protein ACRD2G_09630 [Terriglobia bacterium]